MLVLFTVLGIPFHKWLRWPRTPFICTGLTLAVLSIVMILYGSFVGRTRFEVKEVTYTSPRLPQTFDGYRIVQLSDFHWKSKQDQDNNLIELKQRQAAMGWKLLNNEHTFLIQGNDSIALIGVENQGEPPFSQHGDLPKAKAGIEGMFKLLLSHNPTHWRREVLPESDIDLMLAGHTHAMQLQLGNYSPSVYIYPEWGGMYLEGTRGLYVNVGIGYVGLPFRFGAWPEITVLTLRR